MLEYSEMVFGHGYIYGPVEGIVFIMSESFCREGAGSDSQCLEQEPGHQEGKDSHSF